MRPACLAGNYTHKYILMYISTRNTSDNSRYYLTSYQTVTYFVYLLSLLNLFR